MSPVRGGPWCSSGSGSSSARPPCCAASPRPPWAPKARTSVMSVLAATGGGGRLSSPRVCVEDLWFSELGRRARVHVGQATLPGVGVHSAHGQRPGATPPSRGTRAAGPCRAVASGEGAGSGDSDTICHGVSALLWHLAQPWRHPEQARLWGSAALPPEARTASRGSWPLTCGDSWPAGRGSWASPRRCAGGGSTSEVPQRQPPSAQPPSPLCGLPHAAGPLRPPSPAVSPTCRGPRPPPWSP